MPWDANHPPRRPDALDREIWDCHAHITSGPDGIEGPGRVEARVDWLLERADRVGIARVNVLMGTAWAEDPSPDDLRKANDEVLAAIAHAPRRILGFVYVSPKHIRASLREMDRCIGDGPMSGVKLWVAMRCHHPELDPIVRKAVALNVPVLQHCYRRVAQIEPNESSSADLAVLAARHPDASFICAHADNDWEQGIRQIRTLPNVMAEVSGSDPTAGFVEMAVRELGPDRVLFGSDAGPRGFGSQLAKVQSADLSDETKRMILGGNFRRLLRARRAALGERGT